MVGTINGITEVDFLNLSFEGIRNIVEAKKKPEVAIYILDGNRRAVMTHSKAIPNSDDFYMEYVNLLQKHIVDNLKIFLIMD